MSFQNKVAWITGASSGIGKAIAYALHEKGAKLILSSRRREILNKVKHNCSGDTSDIHILPLDLADSDSLPQRTQQALGIYGHIDYLFNNGGVSQRALAVNTSMGVTRRMMEINFFGAVTLTQGVLPTMIERQSGHIIVTSSVMGKFGTHLRSSYAASKHALHGYFDCLRHEIFDDNIHVSLVCPGFIKTDITKNALEGDGSKHNQMGKGQSEGMSADEFAQKLLPKITKQQEEIYIGGKEIWAVYLKRFFPRLLNKIIRRTDVT